MSATGRSFLPSETRHRIPLVLNIGLATVAIAAYLLNAHEAPGPTHPAPRSAPEMFAERAVTAGSIEERRPIFTPSDTSPGLAGGHLLDSMLERDKGLPIHLGSGVTADGISSAELEAMRAAGGRCPSSLYSIAWPVAGVFRVDPALVAAVIDSESACHTTARSSANAIGLMQLMQSGGAREAYRMIYGKDGVPTAAALKDPNANLWLGIGYLRFLLDHYAYVHSSQARLRLAVAAYNWNYGRLDKALRGSAATMDSADVDHWIAMHAPRETALYVPHVMGRAARFAAALQAARTTTPQSIPTALTR